MPCQINDGPQCAGGFIGQNEMVLGLEGSNYIKASLQVSFYEVLLVASKLVQPLGMTN